MAATVAVGLFLTSAPSAAQNLFEAIFGAARRMATAPPPARAIADPITSLFDALTEPRIRRDDSGPARVFCVRTCDGRYFPITATGGASPAAMCRAFCPASETRIFAGGSIDRAVATNGAQYADLKNAFVYRDRLVPGCTCNGRDALGLARLNIASDPTLQRGDIVVTSNGLAAVTGKKNQTSQFTPVDSYAGFSKRYREQLSDVEVMPPNPGAPMARPHAIPSRETTGSANDSRAQLSR